MPGTLHLVATPIGNLEDITLRALRVLREVAAVAAEDTRQTAKLFAHYGITTPLVSYHAHNSRSRLPGLLRRLQAGDDLALVTDAGTPGVSDPGAELVQACLEAGIPVNPVPGASAPLAALVASGFPLVPFTFLGFAPHKSSQRAQWLRDASTILHTFCFFDAPSRIVSTLTQAAEIWGERPMALARETTKLHQEFLYGPADSLKDQIKVPKGEFTVVVGPSTDVLERTAPATDTEMAQMFAQLTKQAGVARRDAIAAVARTCRRPAREVYAAVERSKHKDEAP